MKQEINLYLPELRPKSLASSGDRLLRGGFALLLLAAGAYGFLYWQNEQLRGRLMASHDAFEQTLRELEAQGQRLQPREPEEVLLAELARLESLASASEQLRQVLARDAFGNREGYSRYFIALARQVVEGVWLTGVTIRGAGKGLVIEGRSHVPERVPRYLQRLSSEETFRGTEFRVFRLERPQDRKARTGAKAGAAYVEFLVRNDMGTQTEEPGDERQPAP